MCDTCGCGNPGNEIKIQKPGEEDSGHHTHHIEHDHEHDHHGETHSHTHEHHFNHVHSHEGEHSHENDHHHHHDHDHSHGTQIDIGRDILQNNNLIAERNRGFFEAKGITALNLVSSPGSGKTSLLEKTILDTRKRFSMNVIEGDQQTMQDAYRIEASGNIGWMYAADWT